MFPTAFHVWTVAGAAHVQALIEWRGRTIPIFRFRFYERKFVGFV